jgi:hypothetical protein
MLSTMGGVPNGSRLLQFPSSPLPQDEPWLNVLVFTRSERLASDIERVCVGRGHGSVRLSRIGEIGSALSSNLPNALVLDAGDLLGDGVRTASSLRAVYPSLTIVLAASNPPRASEDGFRVVDSWRAGERFVDAVELAYIGIPAPIDDPHARHTTDPHTSG